MPPHTTLGSPYADQNEDLNQEWESLSTKKLQAAPGIQECTKQYQPFSLIRLPRTVSAQLRRGAEAYKFSDRDHLPGRGGNLWEMRLKGKALSEFNREQQGDIARDFYFALKQNADDGGWVRFIHENRSLR